MVVDINSLHSIFHAVIDHGVSNVEITLEEGLQDIPPLVGEIQERLQSEF